MSFAKTTLPFIRGLGARLAAWVDHHDHERHTDYAEDTRFTLCTKAEHGACPEMISEELVRQAGPVDTIVAHLDLDGLYSAAKWICGGLEVYPGADEDAYRVDTRTGEPGPIARKVDRALRARFRDDQLKRSVVLWLATGRPRGVLQDVIEEAEREFDAQNRGTAAMAKRYSLRADGRIALVDVRADTQSYDKTELLLLGQKRAPIAVVWDAGSVTFAARYDSGWDFVRLFGLQGGMPTRVTLPEAELQDAMAAIVNATPPDAGL